MGSDLKQGIQEPSDNQPAVKCTPMRSIRLLHVTLLTSYTYSILIITIIKVTKMRFLLLWLPNGLMYKVISFCELTLSQGNLYGKKNNPFAKAT